MRKDIGFKEAFSIGVGGMIGGGIFAVLGLSVQLSKSSAPIAFLLAGLIALITSYSYAKLSIRFPSEGGTVEFLVKAFGNGIFSGGLNILLLLGYIVMVSLYAYAFGSYGANLLSDYVVVRHILITAVISLFTFINAYGALVSGKTEDLLVAFKLTILIVVAGVGLTLVNPERLQPSTWVDPVSIVAGGMIIFLAYEGFELIANTGNDVKDPKILPKALYSAVIVVIAVYVLVAVVTVGTLPYETIVESRDYALAKAAEPSMGEAGFLLVTLAALASTGSAINATLYGTARISYMVAKYGELPQIVERRVWKQAHEGLLVISIISLILANTANLESISVAGSGSFLIIFFFVNVAALKLRHKLKINPAIPAAGAILTFAALSILVYRMAAEATNLAILVGLVLASFLIEALYRTTTGRKISVYVDSRLKKREETIRNWEGWIAGVVDGVSGLIKDAEIYLAGSVARGEVDKAHDVDLLVFVDDVSDDMQHECQKAMRNLPVDLHFISREDKESALKKAKHYKRLEI
ncbi:amino acid permease [Archaeoglobus neptunius]|uniref:amino acid permease n=1 Tax=Archaeoglobus neptunius TaxID=2798580 RepID=UPI0019294DE6|nr:amino acid permease [Archaeoglobus neptunius]